MKRKLKAAGLTHSASRRRAEAALWRATKAGGLALSHWLRVSLEAKI